MFSTQISLTLLQMCAHSASFYPLGKSVSIMRQCIVQYSLILPLLDSLHLTDFTSYKTRVFDRPYCILVPWFLLWWEMKSSHTFLPSQKPSAEKIQLLKKCLVCVIPLHPPFLLPPTCNRKESNLEKCHACVIPLHPASPLPPTCSREDSNLK